MSRSIAGKVSKCWGVGVAWIHRDDNLRVACVMTLLRNNGSMEHLLSVDGDVLKFSSNCSTAVGSNRCSAFASWCTRGINDVLFSHFYSDRVIVDVDVSTGHNGGQELVTHMLASRGLVFT